MLADSEVERALVVQAHPDDVDFGAAGTVASWTRAGIDVVYCICTDGQAGGFDDDIPRAEMPRIRRAEQQKAAAAVGVTDVRFLGGMDGELTVTADLVRELTAVIRQVRPQRVLFPSPERNWDFMPASHPDHLAAGEATIRAIYPSAENPYAFPELAERGLEAWKVSEIWLSAHPTRNHVVDITDVFDLKMAALLCHASQHPEPDQLEPMLRQGLGRAAVEAGLPEGRLAEEFSVHSLR